MGALCVKKNDLLVEKNDFGIGTRRKNYDVCFCSRTYVQTVV